MLATRVNGLHVCYGEMELTRNVPSKLDDGGWGWRIKLDASDENGARNEQQLKRVGRMWFIPDGSMYVYYTPTHWSHK